MFPEHASGTADLVDPIQGVLLSDMPTHQAKAYTDLNIHPDVVGCWAII